MFTKYCAFNQALTEKLHGFTPCIQVVNDEVVIRKPRIASKTVFAINMAFYAYCWYRLLKSTSKI